MKGFAIIALPARTIAILALSALAAALALAVSCTKDSVYSCNPGDEIHFAAGSTTSAQGTKAA